MQLDQGKISSSQLMILAFAFMMGSSVILAPGGGAKQNAWLAILGGALEALLFVWIYTALANRFPGKTLIQMNDLVYGRYFGKFISSLFLWYFFHLGSLVLRNFGDFFKLIMTDTPLPVFEIVIVALCAYAVYMGIEVIARCGVILAFFLLIFTLANSLLMINLTNYSNLLPIMHMPISQFLAAAHGSASFPFAESVAFLMVFAFINKQNESRASLMKAVIFAGLLLSYIAIRNTAVLGALAAYQAYPSYTAVRLINVGDIITRVDILLATNLLSMGFIKVAVLYFAVVLGLAQVFHLKNQTRLIIPVGILMMTLSVFQFTNTMENINFAFMDYPYYSLPFQFFLPLLTLIIAAVRKLRIQPDGGEAV